jgi:thioesterase domain-containing protein/acyl carrier protein
LSEELNCSPDEVGTEIPLENLGAVSLIAVMLSGDLAKFLDRELPATLLWEFRDIRKLSEHLAELCGDEESFESGSGNLTFRPGQASGRYVVPLQPAGSRTPLFCAHGSLGFVAKHISRDQPFYTLRPHGYDLLAIPGTLKEMAHLYLQEVRAVQPCGPYRIGGYSAGCVTAIEMAQQLIADGEVVEVLILLDPKVIRGCLASNPERKPSAAKQVWRLFIQVRKCFRRCIAQTSLGLFGRVPRYLRNFHHLSASARAIRQFVPSPYPGRVKIFRARDDESHSDPTMGCDQFVTGEIETIDVDGRHLDMLDAPYAEDVAQKLQECLDTLTPARARRQSAQ